MIDALGSIPMRNSASIPRYPIARFLLSAAEVLLHPIVTLPVLVYLLGGSPGQIVVYAIVAGVAAGLSAASGATNALLPGTTRTTMVILLALQAIGFILTGILAIGVDTISNDGLIGLLATAYVLLIAPSGMLARLTEQAYEFRRPAAAAVGSVMPAVAGSLLGGFLVWRLFNAGGMGPDDLLARIVVTGALVCTAAAWLASSATVLSMHLPHPARPMPNVKWPGLRSNTPLLRYMLYLLVQGCTRFADPFLLVGALTIIAPDIVWMGGAVLAFALGDAVARLASTTAFRDFDVRVLFTVGGFLHAIAYIVIAFAADVFSSSVIADTDPGTAWKRWSIVSAAIALGTGYRFTSTGHRAYVRSMTSPHTRDLALTTTGVVMIAVAFAPIAAVRLLGSENMETLLQIGAGASIVGLLATALVVPTFAAPHRPRGAWGFRR